MTLYEVRCGLIFHHPFSLRGINSVQLFLTQFKIRERDVLQMVGLDAYMLLRYQRVCLKLACFLSFWGVIVLVPVYSTVATTEAWEQYTIFNVLHGDEAKRYR